MAKDLNLAKYHAYKALNGIEKTKGNFMDCGCEGAIESLESTLDYLKTATKTGALTKAKPLLHKALERTIIGINVLREFEEETSSDYGSNVLVMNTTDVLDFNNGMMLTQGLMRGVITMILLKGIIVVLKIPLLRIWSFCCVLV